MAAAVLLVVFVAASWVIVRIGAAALELTGMPWERAKFQALSAFTNAGFTTAESEEVTRHPVRRRIASWLIIGGNAGLVTTIGSFAGSVMGANPLSFGLNLGAIIAGAGFVFWLARKPRLAQRMRVLVQRRLMKRYGQLTLSAEQLLRFDEGFNLTKISLAAGSPVVGRTLSELRLKQNKLQVLAIERDKDFMPVPDGNAELRAGDKLVVYGVTEQATDLFKPKRAQTLTILPHSEDASPPT